MIFVARIDVQQLTVMHEFLKYGRLQGSDRHTYKKVYIRALEISRQKGYDIILEPEVSSITWKALLPATVLARYEKI